MWSRLPSGSQMRRLALPGLLTIWISGCSPAVISSCRTIPLPAYAPPFEAAVVAQMRETGPELRQFALDAVALRDAVRGCRG